MLLKMKDIQAKSEDQLQESLFQAYKSKLFLKGVRALGNAKNIYEYKNEKLNIARIKTVINERKKTNIKLAGGN